MNWQVNDYVVHSKKSEWGVGKIFKADPGYVSVFFIGAGGKEFALPTSFLSPAPMELQAHPLLENLAPQVLIGKAKVLPLAACMRFFCTLFKGGFQDPDYLQSERNYKINAAELAHSLLSESTWSEMLTEGHFGEICTRLGKIESKTNLLHSFEKIKWQAALKDAGLQPLLAQGLFDELFGGSSRMPAFDALVNVLGKADGCTKWTIATYYGALYHPESRLFIKPEVTKYAAEACGWDIRYESRLNWCTLQRVEALGKYLFEALTQAGLQPRDMIDVQSFIWAINPDTYASISALNR